MAAGDVLVQQRAAFGAGHVGVAPAHDRHHDRIEVDAPLGEAVLVALGALAVGHFRKRGRLTSLCRRSASRWRVMPRLRWKSSKRRMRRKQSGRIIKVQVVADHRDVARHRARLATAVAPAHEDSSGRVEVVCDRQVLFLNALLAPSSAEEAMADRKVALVLGAGDATGGASRARATSPPSCGATPRSSNRWSSRSRPKEGCTRLRRRRAQGRADSRAGRDHRARARNAGSGRLQHRRQFALRRGRTVGRRSFWPGIHPP